MSAPDAETIAAIVQVGPGRGFLVEVPLGRLVITAAHCLPELPVPLFSDEIYRRLLGPLDEDPTIGAECLFVDPVADVAVLASPDNQTYGDEADAYEAFVDARPTLRVGALTRRSGAWLLSLPGAWISCAVDMCGPRALSISGQETKGGMSGSPIIARNRAIGIVTTSANAGLSGQPALISALPGWLLVDLVKSSKLRVDALDAMKTAWHRKLDRMVGRRLRGVMPRLDEARRGVR